MYGDFYGGFQRKMHGCIDIRPIGLGLSHPREEKEIANNVHMMGPGMDGRFVAISKHGSGG